MFFKSIPLLISLAQAAKILQPPNPHIASAQSARVNGTLTSFTIIEGSGCPAGSYHAVPISPGASLNTYVDVDPSIYAYNSTTSTAPASCTFLIDFEFVFPEDGVAEINLDTITYNDAQFEDGDGNKTTNFKANFDMVVAMSGTEGFNGSIEYTRIIDEGPKEFDVGVFDFPVGTPGEKGTGSFQTTISIFTKYGAGAFSVSRIAIGFGLWADSDE